MDPITLEASRPVATGAAPTKSFAELTTEDFFSLLVSQLTNQDPFEPTGNEELLQQISSIRDIELSTTLAASLQSLLGQERFSSASSLIGRYVTSLPDEQGIVHSGVTLGVRLDAGGKPILQLSGGAELSLDQVNTIESAGQAAESLIGKYVAGMDRRDAANPKVVEGIAVAVRNGDANEIFLELDTGESLRLRDLVSVESVEL